MKLRMTFDVDRETRLAIADRLGANLSPIGPRLATRAEVTSEICSVVGALFESLVYERHLTEEADNA